VWTSSRQTPAGKRRGVSARKSLPPENETDGGGVDLALAARARIRLGGDYRRVLGDDDGDQWRATASLVVPFGAFN
jgi:hypothetical protein